MADSYPHKTAVDLRCSWIFIEQTSSPYSRHSLRLDFGTSKLTNRRKGSIIGRATRYPRCRHWHGRQWTNFDRIPAYWTYRGFGKRRYIVQRGSATVKILGFSQIHRLSGNRGKLLRARELLAYPYRISGAQKLAFYAEGPGANLEILARIESEHP